jgi:lipoprotein-releasing system permease protein
MMISHGGATSGLLVKGIDPDASPRVLDIAHRLEFGEIHDLVKLAPPSTGGKPLPGIFLGQELAKKIKARAGDKVQVMAPKSDLDPAAWSPDGGGAGGSAQPTLRELRVAGIFYTGFDEYDRRLAYVSLPEAQAFFGARDVVTGVEMRVDDIDEAARVAVKLESDLGGSPYKVIDWETLNRNLFAALRMQKIVLTIVLTIIIVVAGFNIIAAMTMLAVDKMKEIAILGSMGMRPWGIARVFLIAGLAIGAFGTAAGLAVGVLICFVIERFGYALDPSVYLIDKLPVQIHGKELLLTAGITMGICALMTIYPAVRAATMRVVDGLRYE